MSVSRWRDREAKVSGCKPDGASPLARSNRAATIECADRVRSGRDWDGTSAPCILKKGVSQTGSNTLAHAATKDPAAPQPAQTFKEDRPMAYQDMKRERKYGGSVLSTQKHPSAPCVPPPPEEPKP